MQIIERSNSWLTYFLKIFKIRYLRYPCRVNSNMKDLLILLQGLHWQPDHVLASLGRLMIPLCIQAQGDCPCAEGYKAEVPQPSLVQVFICPSATMIDEEKPEDCSLSTSQRNCFGRSGYFIQTLNSFVLSSSHHCQKLWIFLCAKNQICFRPQIIKTK